MATLEIWRRLSDLKTEFQALLLVDEAHATGVIGPHGAGWVAALGLTRQVDIQMGTLSKAFGASGGFICGSKTLIQLLVNRARSFIYSTALPPSCAAAASAALEIIRAEEGDTLRSRLRSNVRLLVECLTPALPARSRSSQSDLSAGDRRRATRPCVWRQSFTTSGFLATGHSLPDGCPRYGSSSDRTLLFAQSGADTIAFKNHNCVAIMHKQTAASGSSQMAVRKGNSGKGVKLSSLST